MLLVMTKRRQEFGDVVIMQPVERPAPFPPHVDKPSLAKQPELMGCAALGHTGEFSKLVDSSLLIEHCPQQLQATARSKEPDRIRQLIRLGFAERSLCHRVFRRACHGRKRYRLVHGDWEAPCLSC